MNTIHVMRFLYYTSIDVNCDNILWNEPKKLLLTEALVEWNQVIYEHKIKTTPNIKILFSKETQVCTSSGLTGAGGSRLGPLRVRLHRYAL